MTCEEFRKMIDAGKTPLDMTRAERAVMLNHMDDCVHCREYVCNYNPVLTPEQQARVKARVKQLKPQIKDLYAEDCQDQEFREALKKL